MRRRLTAILLSFTALSFTALGSARGALAGVTFQLVESAPVETTLDHADIPNAADVWVAMIDGAKTSIDLSEFYVSSARGSRLEQVIGALEKAGKRGVKIRFIVDATFRGSIPEDLDRLSKMKGVELRRIDFEKLAGGVQHAKYFLVDGREAYVGSQNFDWRSLEHVQELGIRLDEPGLVSALQDVFETDWALAGGASPDTRIHNSKVSFPVTIGEGEAALKVTPALSPTGWIPDEALYDLPQIVKLIDDSKKSVRVQLMNYKATEKKQYWATLETALRSAAARGVHVELLVADWSKRSGNIEGLQSLASLPNIDVTMITIPQWSGGFIPFARVIHAKFMVVDGTKSWLGTSNWGKDYFYQTRGVGFIVEGASFAAALDRLFQEDWSGSYAEPVVPGVTYKAPKIAD